MRAQPYGQLSRRRFGRSLSPTIATTGRGVANDGHAAIPSPLSGPLCAPPPMLPDPDFDAVKSVRSPTAMNHTHINPANTLQFEIWLLGIAFMCSCSQ